jgi:MOSC domain-containing protein YiiM
VECESESDTSNNSGEWNRIRIIQTEPAQHSGKSRNQRTAESSHIGHCTHTAGSANAKVQNHTMRNNITLYGI